MSGDRKNVFKYRGHADKRAGILPGTRKNPVRYYIIIKNKNLKKNLYISSKQKCIIYGFVEKHIISYIIYTTVMCKSLSHMEVNLWSKDPFKILQLNEKALYTK